MKKYSVLFLLLSLMLAGCAQTVTTYGVGSIDTVPKTTYTLYEYSSGPAGLNRVILLKHPESTVEVVPYSAQISTLQGTPADAMHFMDRGRYYKHMPVLGVSHNGKTVGYLLGPVQHIFSRDSIEVNLFEREGKIYFSVFERTYND
ncbi:MAG: hypothetical protein HZB62_09245 [Nitrospirae bacterium]|nr:hypothetical protein [Nitrospirota bacterium]